MFQLTFMKRIPLKTYLYVTITLEIHILIVQKLPLILKYNLSLLGTKEENVLFIDIHIYIGVCGGCKLNKT